MLEMMIPGMIDTHIHQPGLVLSELYEVQLFGITSLEGYIEAVRQFINQHPGIENIKYMNDDRYLLNKNEWATVEQMTKSFTINGAYAMALDQETGSIERGKQADLVVLDQKLLIINPINIAKVKVVMTFFAGKLVYEDVGNW